MEAKNVPLIALAVAVIVSSAIAASFVRHKNSVDHQKRVAATYTPQKINYPIIITETVDKRGGKIFRLERDGWSFQSRHREDLAGPPIGMDRAGIPAIDVTAIEKAIADQHKRAPINK